MKIKVVWERSENPEDFTEVIPYEDNLDGVCENGEVSLIVAKDVLDFIRIQEIDGFLNEWLSKLGHQGVLILDGTDFGEVVRLFYNDGLSLSDANLILFGEGNKKSVLTAYELCETLKRMGLLINKCRWENGRYSIEAIRS